MGVIDEKIEGRVLFDRASEVYDLTTKEKNDHGLNVLLQRNKRIRKKKMLC